MKRVLGVVLAGLMIITALTACSGIKKLTPAGPEATTEYQEAATEYNWIDNFDPKFVAFLENIYTAVPEENVADEAEAREKLVKATRKFVDYALKNGEFNSPAQVAHGTASYLEEKDKEYVMNFRLAVKAVIREAIEEDKELKVDPAFRKIVGGVVDGIRSVK